MLPRSLRPLLLFLVVIDVVAAQRTYICLHYHSAPVTVAEYCLCCVCLCLSVCQHISGTIRTIFAIFLRVTHDHIVYFRFYG